MMSFEVDNRSYVSRLWSKIGVFSVRFADVLGFAGPPILATIFYLAGKPFPPILTDQMTYWLGGGFLFAAALRLLAAPYLVWRDDKATITRLINENLDPSRQRIIALQANFDSDRASLLKRLLTIAGDIRHWNEAFAKPGVEVVKELYPLAAPFLIERDFKHYWFTFEKNAKGFDAVKQWSSVNDDQASQHRAGPRFSFHATFIDISIDAMASFLAGSSRTHRAEYDRRCAEQAPIYFDRVDFSFAVPDREGFDEVNLSELTGDHRLQWF